MIIITKKVQCIIAAGLIAATAAHADMDETVFYADFEGSVLVNDTVTAANLNAGTAVGSWAVGDDQESDIRSGNSNTALLADTGQYRFTANFSQDAVLTNNGVTISLDTYMRRTGDASADESYLKPQKIVGLATHGYELFDIRINAGLSHVNALRVGYVDAAGTIQYLGSSGDVNSFSVDTPSSSKFQTLELTLHETTMDISYDGTVLATGIAYRNSGLSHINGLQLAGVNTRTGAFYDHIAVSASIVSTNEAWPRIFFVPHNTQGDNLIHVTTADFDAVGAKDYVVGMSVDNKLIAFQRPSVIGDPAADNRIWEQDLGTYAVAIAAADVQNQVERPSAEEILVPCTDGHLRIYNADGSLRNDWSVSDGALYCVAVGLNASGNVRIVTGGVDGKVYLLNNSGTVVKTITPAQTGIIRALAVGDFDGAGADEVLVAYSQKSFANHKYFELYDLTTEARPAYWSQTAPMEDDQNSAFNWETRLVLWAYDMDGDGDDEVVTHWGVLHPENGGATNLSAAVATGERLRRDKEYIDLYETPTTKYLLPQAVPGDFKNTADYPGAEMLTIYGDDLYMVDYDLVNEPEWNRFRVQDYAYAHSAYHFTGSARLEDRSGGLDRIVLAGPATGDDHFYVVDLSSDHWKDDAKWIDGNGVLGTVRASLQTLKTDIAGFAGTAAAAGDPIWFQLNVPDRYLIWDMDDPVLNDAKADKMLAEVQVWRDKLGATAGYMPQRVHFVAKLRSNPVQKEFQTEAGLVDFCEALAERGVHFSLSIGDSANLYMTAENLADCFEASIVSNECYMMARTGELQRMGHFDVYKPHLDAVIARAAALGVPPPKVVLSAKGALFSAMDPAQAASFFPVYKDVLVPGVEASNTTMPDWSVAERAGLWLNGDVEAWSCDLIGDNLTANRIMEWGGMRNAHVVLRYLLSQYALGANIFRMNTVTAEKNPLYEMGDTSDPELEYTDTYELGLWNFLKLVESGIYPNSPSRNQLKGISPVAAALHQPNHSRLQEQELKHSYNLYNSAVYVATRTNDYVIARLACWDGYTAVPDHDATAILLGATRRWDNLIPHSPGGFAPMVPYATRAQLEANPWCRRAYQTDADTWSEFSSLTNARDTIAAELLAQAPNLAFYVEGECFWMVTADPADPNTLFVVLMDSGTLTPSNRTVNLKLGSAPGTWDVFDQFGSQVVPLATLASASEGVELAIPAGSIRMLALKRTGFGGALAVAWHSPETTAQNTPAHDATPDVSLSGITGLLSGGRDAWASFNSTNGTYGALVSHTIPGSAANAIRVRAQGVQDEVTLSLTNGSSGDITLDAFHFDFGGFDAGPLDFELVYAFGDLDEADSTRIASGSRTFGYSHQGVYSDHSLSLSPALLDADLASGESATFLLRFSNATNVSSASGIDNLAVTVSSANTYEGWISEFGLTGSNAWKSADLEPDGMDNWTEYVFGGNPTNHDASTVVPDFGIDGDWMDYVYRRRTDHAALGVVYTVEATTNLVSNDWNTNGVTQTGEAIIDAEFDAVTNRILTTEKPQQFIRLKVE